jgi:predicted esterase
MPGEWDPAQERSLMVILHGAGGTETGMAGSLAHLAEDGFVVVAPKSAGPTWAKADLDAVRRIVADLKKRLRIGEGRLHGAGFSNGGWNLAPVVFDESLGFASATWIAAGYKGGSVPKSARKTMGVLALAGSEDGNRDAAEKTPDLLEGKVRSAECRIQPGLGHEWPGKLVPYFRWWLLVQEGRFTPGDCAAFEWNASPAEAEALAKRAGSGIFLYYYDPEARDEAARTFQNETLRDPLVQRFGGQLAAMKNPATPGSDGLKDRGISSLPAVLLLDQDSRTLKVLCGKKLDARSLAAAFRTLAPDKSLPKR